MIDFTTITKLSDGTWEFDWIPTSAEVYRVVLFGNEIDRTLEPPYIAKVDGYVIEPPPIEIAEDDEESLSETNTPFIILQWWPNRNAEFYDVQRYTSGEWQSIKKVLENDSSVYTVRSLIETDNEVVQYRITANDSIEQISDPLAFTALIVCSPVISDGDTEVTYATGDITVT